MTDLVVLLLVVLWIAVLTPRVVRHFREGSEQSSIDDFHQQLHLLERTGPKLVEPAYRLADDDEGAATGLAPSTPGRRAALALLDPQAGEAHIGHPVGRTTGRRPAAASRRARRRRRDVLLGFVGTAFLTGVLGAMHDLHMLWAVTAIAVLGIAAYVGLAAYAQLLDADRGAATPVTQGGQVPTLEPAWLSHRPRHAAGDARPGVQVLTSAAPVAVRGQDLHERWAREVASLPRHAASAR